MLRESWFGKYRVVLESQFQRDWFHPGLRQTLPAIGSRVVIGRHGVSWHIEVVMPEERSISGSVFLHGPTDLRKPLSQILTKRIKVSPSARLVGKYVAELRLCGIGDHGRVFCRQARIDEPYPEIFSAAGISSVRYSEHRPSPLRTNFARAWLFDSSQVELMALCFYLSRIESLILQMGGAEVHESGHFRSRDPDS
ncbi:MAG: hypothetical protein ACTSYX_12630 [Candidatus Thorarchaeota archaeon]